MEHPQSPIQDERQFQLFRYAWRDAATGREGGGMWCTDAAVVKEAVKQAQVQEPGWEVWLETRELVYPDLK